MDVIFTSPPASPNRGESGGPAQGITNQPPSSPAAKGTFKKFLNLGTWVVLFALLPVTVLIFLSQNTVPGDLFYPVKRSLENVVLAAASVSPVTRAAFRTDLTTRRFDEAEKLLLASSGINGLKDFVTEIQAAQNEVAAISDSVKKQELQQKIQTSVTEYEKRLNVVKVKLVAEEKISQLALAPTNTAVPVPTSTIGQQAIPTNTPVALPTSTPKPSIRSKLPTTTQAPVSPTSASTKTQIPTSTPTLTPIPSFTPIPTPTPQPSYGGETIETVDRVQQYLHCLNTTPPPHRECMPPDIKSATFNTENRSENRSERRREEKEERKEGNEDGRKDKHEKEKKDSSNREK